MFLWSLDIFPFSIGLNFVTKCTQVSTSSSHTVGSGLAPDGADEGQQLPITLTPKCAAEKLLTQNTSCNWEGEGKRPGQKLLYSLKILAFAKKNREFFKLGFLGWSHSAWCASACQLRSQSDLQERAGCALGKGGDVIVWKLGVQDPISLHGWQEHVRHNGILREGTYRRLRGLQ